MNSSEAEKAKKVGEVIKSIREEKNMTQAEVAKKAGFKNTNYYAVIERGEAEAGFTKMQKIAEALGVDISEILGTK